MVEQYGLPTQESTSQFDLVSKLRDLEEKERLLKERILLMGKTLIEERDKSFHEIQDMKKSVSKLKEDNLRMKELLERIAEQLNNSPRREEFLILQRQLDILRSSKTGS